MVVPPFVVSTVLSKRHQPELTPFRKNSCKSRSSFSMNALVSIHQGLVAGFVDVFAAFSIRPPAFWIYVQEPEVKLGRLQIFNNWSPYLVRDPLHTLWIGLEYFCQEGDALWSMTDEDFLAFAAKELETIQVIRPGAVQEGHVVRMKKAYPAYYGSYRDFPRLRQELDTIPNLYCMGRNGQHRYNNMDHSMLSALTAVDLIRQGETDKTALWQVNTEQEYQETETQGGQNHEK